MTVLLVLALVRILALVSGLDLAMGLLMLSLIPTVALVVVVTRASWKEG